MMKAKLKTEIQTKGITLRQGAEYEVFSYRSEIVGRDYWMNECKIKVPLYGIVCVPTQAVELLEM